jgi:hypothetical protein
MNTGTNVRDVSKNSGYSLKLGYIFVINLSENTINRGVVIADHRGISFLTTGLNRLLMEHF